MLDQQSEKQPSNKSSSVEKQVQTSASKPNHWKTLAVMLGLISLTSISMIVVILYHKSQPIFQLTNNNVTQPTPTTEFAQPTVTSTAGKTDPAEWQTYTNDKFNFEFKYPPEFEILSSNHDVGIGELPNTVFSIEKTKSFSNTNLGTKHNLLLQINPEITTAQQCLVNGEEGNLLTQNKDINGEKFYYTDRSKSAALGTNYVREKYKVFKNNTCIEINFIYSEGSDWNNPEEFRLAETDQQLAFITFDQILSTFKL